MYAEVSTRSVLDNNISNPISKNTHKPPLRGSTDIYRLIRSHSKYPQSVRRVLTLIMQILSTNSTFWMGTDRIENELGLSRSSVFRALSILEKDHIIERELKYYKRKKRRFVKLCDLAEFNLFHTNKVGNQPVLNSKCVPLAEKDSIIMSVKDAKTYPQSYAPKCHFDTHESVILTPNLEIREREKEKKLSLLCSSSFVKNLPGARVDPCISKNSDMMQEQWKNKEQHTETAFLQIEGGIEMKILTEHERTAAIEELESLVYDDDFCTDRCIELSYGFISEEEAIEAHLENFINFHKDREEFRAIKWTLGSFRGWMRGQYLAAGPEGMRYHNDNSVTENYQNNNANKQVMLDNSIAPSKAITEKEFKAYARPLWRDICANNEIRALVRKSSALNEAHLPFEAHIHFFMEQWITKMRLRENFRSWLFTEDKFLEWMQRNILFTEVVQRNGKILVAARLNSEKPKTEDRPTSRADIMAFREQVRKDWSGFTDQLTGGQTDVMEVMYERVNTYPAKPVYQPKAYSQQEKENLAAYHVSQKNPELKEQLFPSNDHDAQKRFEQGKQLENERRRGIARVNAGYSQSESRGDTISVNPIPLRHYPDKN